MRLTVRISRPFPHDIGFSYGEAKFAKFGVIWWEYSGGYRSPVEFINWEYSAFQPPWPEPEAYGIWLRPGVVASWHLIPVVVNRVEDILINNVATSLLRGKGLGGLLP